MRIPSGATNQYIYFIAVDATDLKTRETGLSSFTVYRSRNGGLAAAMTTPTVNETDSSNMPGVYELLLDEDTTIDAGDDSQEMALHISASGMAPVTRVVEIYRPKITAGYTLGVESDGDLTKVNTLDGHTAQTGDSYARLGANGAGLSALPWNSSWDAEVQSECNDALVAINLDHLMAVADSDDVADDSVIAKIASSSGDWSTFISGVHDLETAAVYYVGTYNRVGVAGAGLTDLGGMSSAMKAEINAEADTALADYDPPTKAEQDAAFTEIKGATFSGATDSLEAIRDRGDAAWTTGAGGTPPHLLQTTTIATLASQTSFTLTAGSADNDAYNGAIVVVTDQSTSTQKAVGTVSDYTGATKTVTLSADPGIFTMAAGDTIDVMSALGSAGSAPTAAQIVDEWETQSQADPTGFHVNVMEINGTAQTANDNGAGINTLITQIGTAGAGLTDLGGMSVGMKGEINMECDIALTDYDAVTPADLPANFGDLAITVTTGLVSVGTNIDKTGYSLAADQSSVTIGSVTGNVGGISGTLNTLDALDTAQYSQHSSTQAGLAALNDLSAAQINAEMVDVITVDAIGEIAQGVPSSTPNLADAVMLMYMALRNKVDVPTSGTDTLEIHNDAGTRICQKLLTDDGSDYSEAKMTSGA